MFGKKNTKSEATVAGAEGWVDEWDRKENRKVPFYVAYYKTQNLLRAGRIAVPEARVCPNANATTLDEKGLRVRMCDFPGWDFRRSDEAAPDGYCPGKAWDGKPCGELLQLKSVGEYVRPKNNVIRADTEWLERLCKSRGFPALDDPADDFWRVNSRGDPEHPYRGRTWRQALNIEILPKMRAPGRRKPGERGHATWRSQKRQDALPTSSVERARRRPT